MGTLEMTDEELRQTYHYLKDRFERTNQPGTWARISGLFDEISSLRISLNNWQTMAKESAMELDNFIREQVGKKK